VQLESTLLLSISAGSTDGGGHCFTQVQPTSGEQVMRPITVRDSLGLMLHCGMYDYSGQWAFEIGLPAKSGVSGALIAVVPNRLGLCIWSPRLDAHGNSVRAIEFCRRLMQYEDMHVFHRSSLARREGTRW
jgi:glutaminase